MESPEPGPSYKRIRIDTQPSFTFRICQDRSKQILELAPKSHSHEPATVSIPNIENAIDEGFFQDNSMAFKILLATQNLAVIIYPPGSGKTTMAYLLYFYLSREKIWSDKLTTFFDSCQFAKQCPKEYKKFKKSSEVVYISFERIQGSTRNSFQQSLIDIMLKYVQIYCSEEFFKKEYKTLENYPESVYFSLGRLSTFLYRKHQTSYILLDSCDTVFNTIAQLNEDAGQVCKQFILFLKGSIDEINSSTSVICFGVSPYFANELDVIGHIFDIADEHNKMGPYFSYSHETIQKVIEKFSLDTSYEQCLQVAGFEYNGQLFVNPSLCVSFLRCLRLQKQTFQVNIPRSLWLSCIFNLEDRELLLDVVHAECEREFHMDVSVMSLKENLSDRTLFYPLFIYGGFISCKRLEGNKYSLKVANETSRLILRKILTDIYLRLYRRDFNECNEIIEMIFAEKWKAFCNALRTMLSFGSTRTLKCELDYNNWMFGLLSPARLKGFTVTNNNNLAGLYPDLTFSGPKIGAVWELKYIKVQRKKTLDEMSLEDCFGESDIIPTHKETVLNEVWKALPEAKVQANQYASAFLDVVNLDSVKCLVLIFYLNHVVLLVSDYVSQGEGDNTASGSQIWNAHSSDGFFCDEDLKQLL